MEQCNTISGHSTALLVSQSMDFHPNPGLTAIHIIRLYSLTMQAIQEHKTSTISYPLWTSYFQLQLLYFLSNAHLLTLLINIFFQAGDHFSGKRHFRWWTWHPLPFTPISTHLHKCHRRHRCYICTSRYWRTNNDNMQLDTNPVITLNNITLSHDETKLLARGHTFCPMPQQIDWKKSPSQH